MTFYQPTKSQWPWKNFVRPHEIAFGKSRAAAHSRCAIHKQEYLKTDLALLDSK